MSAPFIYSPHPDSFPHFYRPSNTFFRRPFRNTPFSPNQTIYPSSPYVGPHGAALNTPQFSAAGFSNYDHDLSGGWSTPRQRTRRLSWHGTSSSRVSPFIPPLLLSPSGESRNLWGQQETHSAGGYPSAHHQWPPYMYPAATPLTPNVSLFSASNYVSGYPQYQPPLQIHPWINAEAPSPEFRFDLSTSAFNPQRLVGPDYPMTLSMADLQSPAFYPPVTKLRIICDMIPSWPVDLVYGGSGMAVGGQAPPITLGDILVAIHQKMHQRISHHDWGRLSMAQEAEVSRAFTRRCRESIRHGAPYYSDTELPERQQGVKVVDFLLGKTMFRGLVRTDDGYVKMIVS